MIGIGGHLRKSAIVEELDHRDSDLIHRQARVVADDSGSNWIRRYVLVTAELDELQDVFGVGKVSRLGHALATLARTDCHFSSSVTSSASEANFFAAMMQ
jgi:hypothetical protein